MSEPYTPTDEERAAIAEMERQRRAIKGKAPISRTFKERMASSVVDPQADEHTLPAVDETRHMIFRP